MKRITKRSSIVAATTALAVAIGGGVAFAYWTTSKRLWRRVLSQTNSTPYLCCTESNQTRLLGLRDFMSTSCCR